MIFCCLPIFFKTKSTFFYIIESNSLDPGQARHLVAPHLNLNGLLRLSANNSSGLRVNRLMYLLQQYALLSVLCTCTAIAVIYLREFLTFSVWIIYK